MCSVRFLDNFSAGTRGAISAEYFLKAGYGVIFVHRQFSLQPFSRRYSHSTNPFLNFLEIDAASLTSSAIDSAFPYSNDPLLTTPTPQITQRLPLVSEWNPEGFIVFFKLEIDETNLIQKARQALERYRHQVVIGNDLHYRKYRVVLTSPTAKTDATKKLDEVVVSQPKYAEFWIEIDFHQPSNHPKEIDEDSVAELLKRYNGGLMSRQRNMITGSVNTQMRGWGLLDDLNRDNNTVVLVCPLIEEVALAKYHISSTLESSANFN
ncbi:DNA/pantothenate metabolism flavoprotein [Suillus tomentosus]|nr:DNA/pantothenate metabolism flavoprotein [Suillus tomentosus]